MTNASQVENPFLGNLPELTTLESRYAETMSGIGGLATQFVQAMVERQMPVDILVAGIEDKTTDTAKEKRTTLVPYWVVLSDKNLTGQNMFSGSMSTRIPGRPSASQVFVKREDARRELDSKQTVHYQETQIAVSATGELMRLRKSLTATNLTCNGENRYGIFDPNRYHFSADGYPIASDFFDLSTALTPQRLIGTMLQRMKQAQSQYDKMLFEERRHGPINRPVGYYQTLTKVTTQPSKTRRAPRLGFLEKLLH